jgi:hypothetical protein
MVVFSNIVPTKVLCEKRLVENLFYTFLHVDVDPLKGCLPEIEAQEAKDADQE